MNISFLKECDKSYYNTGLTIISDVEYDLLKDQLRGEYPNDPYFKTVGAPVAGESVHLPYILGSLTKTKANGSLLKWSRENKVLTVTVSNKLDGVSIYAKYVDGYLVRAATRGDGYEGKDITEKIRLIQPSILGGVSSMGVVELRGEAVMTPENRDKLGYSLARSAVSGILKGEDQEHYDLMEYVDLVFYTILGDDIPDWTGMFYRLERYQVNVVSFITMPITSDIEDRLVEHFDHERSKSKWDIDGLVVADQNNTNVGEDYYPTNVVAFKVNEKPTVCTVTGIEWGVKRSGKIQPVVHFEPTNINGSMVSKATGFNMKFVVDNHITIGDSIGVVKAGDIIPYITENFSPDGLSDIPVPTICPSCHSELTTTDSKTDLVCNNISCSGQLLFWLENFLLCHGVEEITSKTLEKINPKSINDLYNLTVEDMVKIDGIGESKARVIRDQLDKSLETTDENFLQSLGIPGIGKTMSDLLINAYGSYIGMLDKGVEDFIEIDGIGEVLAVNLSRGLTRTVRVYTFLRDLGLTFKEKKSLNLQGKIFCLTGKSDISRNDLTQMISSHGGMVKGISKKVDYLVTNDPNGTTGKTKKAHQYGIQIISYEDLISIIG